MKCSQVERLIEDYSDGELDREQVLEMEAHLLGCRNCVSLLESLRRENKMYEDFGKNLEKSPEIPPAMWNRVCHGLDSETPAESRPARKDAGRLSILSNMFMHPTVVRQILAASILMVVAAGGVLLIVHRHDGTKVITANRDQKRDLQYALLSIQRAEREYVQAIQVLSSIVDERKTSLAPGLAAELDRNLKTIDEVIASAQRAYRAHPADPDLAQYMLRAYQKKVELLQDLALTTG